MWIFKDKNKLNNNFISDILIGYTLNLMGKNEEEILLFFKDIKLVRINEEEGLTKFFGLLDNGCIIMVILENNKVFKVIIWLNNKLSKEDTKNLDLFYITHEDEYYFYNLFDNSKEIPEKKAINRYMIAFESKIF